MRSRRILTMFVLASSFFVMTSGGGLTEVNEVKRRKGTNRSVPADRTQRSVFHRYNCEPYTYNVNRTYCKHVLGNSFVFGGQRRLEILENNLRRFEMAKDVIPTLKALSDEQSMGSDNIFNLTQRCLEMVDDLYCHHYFKRCYISPKVQPVCREACELFKAEVCVEELKILVKFNAVRRYRFPHWPYTWDIIDCTTLPFRNQSANCYYPDKVQEQLNNLEREDCFYGDGRGYRGNISTTVSGYTCQSWDEQHPHKHVTEEIHKEIRNSSNFCRNPGGFGLNGPWCYTTKGYKQWDYCDVPRCPKQSPSSPPADFRGCNLSSTSIRVSWGDVPKPSLKGILLGFHVTCSITNSSERHFKDLPPEKHDWEFRRLEEYTNHSCYVRAYNNFGNGTWSEELVVSTDEDVPSAPPERLMAWNLSSTRLLVQWELPPVEDRNGKILGYTVVIIPEQEKHGRTKPAANFTTSRKITFGGLRKYTKYVISISAQTRRGKGPSRVLNVQTDEDVPDRPPRGITTISVGANAVQLYWVPVPSEYTNGKLLGYKVLYSEVNGTTRFNRTVHSPAETRLDIDGLRPNTNYSFQILAFTAKGDGAGSAHYFARTRADKEEIAAEQYQPISNKEKSLSSVTGTITVAVLSVILALTVVFLVIYYVKRRRQSTNFNDEKRSIPVVTPYATSPPNWIEEVIAIKNHEYDTADSENVPCRRPFYVNIAPDGSLDLPPCLRDICFEFEQSYENTNYKRLIRRRSLGGAVDVQGLPMYDTLLNVISPTVTCQGKGFNNQTHEITTAEPSKENKHGSVHLGDLRGLSRVLQGGIFCRSMMEMVHPQHDKNRHHRRFSVDLGDVREFIARREMRLSAQDDSTKLC